MPFTSWRGPGTLIIGLICMGLLVIGFIYRAEVLNKIKGTPKRVESVILDISTQAEGVVYPGEGETLDFRLLESGCVEYDDYPPQDPSRDFSKAVVITRKQAQLGDADINVLLNLMEQADLLNAKSKYPAKYPVVDAVFTTKIRYLRGNQQKEIVIINHDEDDPSEYPSRFPLSLIKLLDEVARMKAELKQHFKKCCER